MVSQDRISRLAQQIGERLQGASQAPEEIQKGVQQVVRGAFDRLELVSREDFDILMDVLQRTRARVEALEKQVASLEAAVEARNGSATEAETPADTDIETR
ncbi:accessory factor UbiK family protein [Halomonas cupida]|uniref:accessory factor UbiK family protein n=1 Tax=Halomonas cupida TaxID=44933 RepID=UPI0039B6D2BF